MPCRSCGGYEAFCRGEVTPQAVCDLENDLHALLSEVGRRVLEWAYNQLEPETAAAMPSQVRIVSRAAPERSGDRFRRNRKTQRSWDTLFGPVAVRRWWYRNTEPGEPGCAPLELALGVGAAAVTPALAERLGRLMAEGTQQQTRDGLAEHYHVRLSVQRLRQATAALAEGLEEHRQAVQGEALQAWLEEAEQTAGPRPVVVAAGRDGVMIPMRCRGGKVYEEAGCATVSVYGRDGKRRGTVYLGQMPQSGQAELTAQMNGVLDGLLESWEAHCRGWNISPMRARTRRTTFTRCWRRGVTRAAANLCAGGGRWITTMPASTSATWGKRSRRGPGGLGLGGQAAAGAARPAERRRPGAAKRPGPAPQARTEAIGAGVRDGGQLPAPLRSAHELRRAPRPGSSHRQRRDGGGLQNDLYATLQTIGHAWDRKSGGHVLTLRLLVKSQVYAAAHRRHLQAAATRIEPASRQPHPQCSNPQLLHDVAVHSMPGKLAKCDVARSIIKEGWMLSNSRKMFAKGGSRAIGWLI